VSGPPRPDRGDSAIGPGGLVVVPLGETDQGLLEQLQEQARVEVLSRRGGAALVQQLESDARGAAEGSTLAWAAFQGNVAVGALRLRLRPGHPVASGEADGRTAWIDLLWVDPSARRRHIGLRLIEEARRALSPAWRLEGPALPGDRAAKSFYESAGMKARLLVMAQPTADPASTPIASANRAGEPALRNGRPERPELSVGGVAVSEGRVLVIRRGHPPGEGTWSFPGGRVEGGEDLASALRREMVEETGLEVEPRELLGWAELIGDTSHHVVLDFLVSVTGGQARPGDDAAEVRWVTLEELFGLPLAPGIARFVAEHREAILRTDNENAPDRPVS